MFIRVVREEGGFNFTVVDILSADKEGEQELSLILDLGVVQACHLDSEQSWYVIAENLIASELDESEKCLLARDIANWLPPLSREGLLKAREEDLRQLAVLCVDESTVPPAIPAVLSEKDPLTIIADWLEGD